MWVAGIGINVTVAAAFAANSSAVGIATIVVALFQNCMVNPGLCTNAFYVSALSLSRLLGVSPYSVSMALASVEVRIIFSRAYYHAPTYVCLLVPPNQGPAVMSASPTVSASPSPNLSPLGAEAMPSIANTLARQKLQLQVQ